MWRDADTTPIADPFGRPHQTAQGGRTLVDEQAKQMALARRHLDTRHHLHAISPARCPLTRLQRRGGLVVIGHGDQIEIGALLDEIDQVARADQSV